MKILKRLVVLLSLSVVVLLGVSSTFSMALMAPTVVEGQLFPVEQATELRAGMSSDEVEALLGAPLRRTSDASVVWRYDFTRRLRECRTFLGPIPLQAARTERHALELVFGRRGLERVVYREVAPGRTAEHMLLDAPVALADRRLDRRRP